MHDSEREDKHATIPGAASFVIKIIAFAIIVAVLALPPMQAFALSSYCCLGLATQAGVAVLLLVS